MAYFKENEEIYHIYKDCSKGKLISNEEKIEGTGERELCKECQARKKADSEKRAELENKKAKKALREKNKRFSKGVWKKNHNNY